MSETKNELSSSLYSLFKKIIDEVNEYKSEGKIFKSDEPVAKEVIQFQYNKGAIITQFSHKDVKQEKWTMERKEYINSYSDLIRHEPMFSDIISEISDKYNLNESAFVYLDFSLQNFLQKIINDDSSSLTGKDIVNYVSVFIARLENTPFNWDIKAWINGIWLEDEEYEIYDGLKIRRPTSSDLENEKSAYIAKIFQTINFNKPAAIIEMNGRAKSHSEIFYKLEVILMILRLFKVGSIFSVQTEIYPPFFFHEYHENNTRFAQFFSYKLTKQDISEINILIKRLEKIMSQDILKIYFGETEPALIIPDRLLEIHSDIDAISIALQRYNDTLLKPETIESRITSIMTCFEALYLKGNEREGISRRLAQRAAIILKIAGKKPNKVYQKLINAYDIRSTYIHGSPIGDGEKEYKHVDKLLEDILDWARLSILIFLQLKPKMDKDKIVNLIDKSMLDEKAHSGLETAIEKNCIGYID
ncbi:hypothetical protein MBMB1_0094 [Methanobacterium sp. MB1]|nr:hypothetical protein MBMB1_0094 [Methanobacterium sp. MB1]